MNNKIDKVQVGPRGTLELLSQREVATLTSTAESGHLYGLFRRCAVGRRGRWLRRCMSGSARSMLPC